MALSKQRTEQLNRLGLQLKMDFDPEDGWGLQNMLTDFKLASIGGSKKIRNMLTHKDDLKGLDFRIFDYTYVVSTGKSSAAIHQTVLYMHSTALALPQFWMKPETILHKIGIWLGLQKDINFEAYPEFSAQYFLKSTDEEYARATMNEQVLRFFTIEKNWSLEGIGYMMLFYRKGMLLTPAAIKDLHDKGMKLHQMLLSEPL